MQGKPVRQCSFCVLDDSVYHLAFDDNGRCTACRDAEATRATTWFPGEEGRVKLAAMAEMLKAAGSGKSYDAVIGLSGGIDSAYLAYVAVWQMGLRVLAVHVDGGWNSSPAVQNIERVVRGLDIDLFTHVVEWEEMADLQLAFLRANVFNQDIPQDHAFFSTLYRTAATFGIDHFLSGVNFSSECVSPKHNAPGYLDARHIRVIHDRFGERPLKRYDPMRLSEYIYRTQVMGRPRILKPLDLLDYDKEKARETLQSEFGWVDYGEKHCESRFTKFYQEIYLPQKFGFDKRRLHLSSVIVSGQMTREAALEVLKEPLITPEATRRDVRFVAKKLGISDNELLSLVNGPAIDHLAYPNNKRVMERLVALRNSIRKRA